VNKIKINWPNQRIITLFPDETTDGGQCWIASVPSCRFLYAQGDTPTEALEALAEFWRIYDRLHEIEDRPWPPELYALVERARLIETDQETT
jgi:predicted RNase H-like HicB family nuclease